MRDDGVKRRHTLARRQRSEQRHLKPAAMLVGGLQIHVESENAGAAKQCDCDRDTRRCTAGGLATGGVIKVKGAGGKTWKNSRPAPDDIPPRNF